MFWRLGTHFDFMVGLKENLRERTIPRFKTDAYFSGEMRVRVFSLAGCSGKDIIYSSLTS